MVAYDMIMLTRSTYVREDPRTAENMETWRKNVKKVHNIRDQ